MIAAKFRKKNYSERIEAEFSDFKNKMENKTSIPIKKKPARLIAELRMLPVNSSI